MRRFVLHKVVRSTPLLSRQVGINTSLLSRRLGTETFLLSRKLAMETSLLSKKMGMETSLLSRPLTSSMSERDTFLSMLSPLISQLSQDPNTPDLHPLLSNHISRMLEYNIRDGKYNRGMAVVSSYNLLASPDQLTQENIKLASVLGWTVELLQAYFLVADDIMDDSETRRGQPCWYKQPEVGLTAINDSILLESCVYSLLRSYFRQFPCYTNLVDNILQISRFTSYGQALDLGSAQEYNKRRGISGSLVSFNMERYSAIVKYKTSYYSFYLPVSLAMILAGEEEEGKLLTASNILLDMGHFFQVQDDVLDCFGDPAVTGKIGTDIQDGKCSWVVVSELERADSRQKDILEENYGTWEVEKVQKVREIFKELELEKVYSEYETDFYNQITSKISGVKGLPEEVFTSFLNRIYKRTS